MSLVLALVLARNPELEASVSPALLYLLFCMFFFFFFGPASPCPCAGVSVAATIYCRDR